MKKIFVLLTVSIIALSSFATSNSDSSVVTIQSGATYKISTIRTLDKVTGTAITANISNVVIQNNNPDVAIIDTTVTSSTIRVTRVNEGSGTATISCHITYTDPGDGLTKSEDKTIVISYTVIGAPHGAKLSLTFN